MLNFIYLANCDLPERVRVPDVRLARLAGPPSPEQLQALAVWIDQLLHEGDPLGRWLQLDHANALDPVAEHDAIRSRFVREIERVIAETKVSYTRVSNVEPGPPDLLDRLQREEPT